MALFRVLAQMSDEEMVVFTAIQEGSGHCPTFSCRTESISAFLRWEHKKVVLACKGLINLIFYNLTSLVVGELLKWEEGLFLGGVA
jgi:hypothetical protein